MQDAFQYVLFAVVGVGVLVALFTFIGTGKAYDEIGRGGLFDDEGPKDRASAPVVDMGEAREMLEARNRRLAARGRPQLDVDEELARLTATTVDAALLAEIREHVEARNQRRIRRGHEPLDVDAEVQRQLRELGA